MSGQIQNPSGLWQTRVLRRSQSLSGWGGETSREENGLSRVGKGWVGRRHERIEESTGREKGEKMGATDSEKWMSSGEDKGKYQEDKRKK